jgi:riboflavin synthase
VRAAYSGTVASAGIASPGASDRRRARVFTGIVEDLGEVEAVDQQGDFAVIYVRSSVVTSDARIGDSICVSGVCLTVTGLIGENGPADGSPDGPPPRGFTADVMGETLRYSSLKSLSPGIPVNLERSVRLEDRLGGHLVQGHTDGTGTILSRVSHQDWDVVRISLPADLARYVVHKGSITVDGISLTVSALSHPTTASPTAANPTAANPTAANPTTHPATASPTSTTSPTDGQQPGGPQSWFEVSLIPETLKRTTMGAKQPGDEVNLEVDVIAKYVEKLMSSGGTR